MLGKIAIWLIKVYQFFSRKFLNRACRFYPTCSQYMIEAIEKYGLIKGLGKGVARILRCHPGHPGGIDLP